MHNLFDSYLTIAGVAGLLISALSLSLYGSRLNARSLMVLIGALILHVAASYYYYEFTKTNSADAAVYYFDPWNWGAVPFSFGTNTVYRITQFFRYVFGATYLDCFLLFQSIGFAGMVIMYRTWYEIQGRIGVASNDEFSLLLFLPSLNFWTSAIGKDGPLFFATALCIWSAVNFRHRYLGFAVSIIVMVLFRPYIALIAVSALAFSAAFDATLSVGKKAGLVVLAVFGLVFVARAVNNTFGLDVSSLGAITTYLDKQNQIFTQLGGTTNVGNASIPVRLISLLFRPFFFDAQGPLALLESAENVGVLLGFIYMFRNGRHLLYLMRKVLFVRFTVAFMVLLIMCFTAVYYNVGLGLRQRVMLYPMFFALVVTAWCVQQKRVRGVGPAPRGPNVTGVPAAPRSSPALYER